jgi:Mn2+/Fe2+ NRAMP family transporter
MKKVLQIALGIVTSVGGFLEIGSLATAAQAGAGFRYQLVWSLALGTLCIIFLVEMAGRFAAVSKHTIADAIRERFGFNLFLAAFSSIALVDLMVLGAEVGGVCLALQLVTGIGFQWWALPVGFVLWLLLWKGSFGLIENGGSLLGLVTLCLVAGAVLLHPHWRAVGAGLLPTLPSHDRSHYWFVAVSVLGASISPYLFLFYSSGAIEDRWDESYLGTNRAVAGLGMSFGGLISVAVLILAAVVLGPRGIDPIDRCDQIAPLLTPVFGRWGFRLFAASLGVSCFGAAAEISLGMAYQTAQGFGWNWGEDLAPGDDPGFSATYTLALVVAVLVVVSGIDPLKLTILSMALTAVSLPFAVVPFLLLMNDESYMGEHRNGRFGNAVVLLIIGLAFVLALVSIPLEIAGS